MGEAIVYRYRESGVRIVMNDEQVKRISLAIRYLGLCIVRAATVVAVRSKDAQNAIDQTLREYTETYDEYHKA